MEALDLSQRPPRGPRVLLPGLDILMMARTVDKVRATLPGGDPGVYHIRGFSSRLLKGLGIAEDELRDAVAKAGTDAEVAAWIGEHSDPAAYPQVNAVLESLTVGERLNDPEFVEKYPIVSKLPPETKLLDMLIADDAEMFEKAP